MYCTTDLSVSVSPSPTIKSPPPRPSVIMSEVEEVTGETVSEEELSAEDESDMDPVIQPKTTLAVPAGDIAMAETEVMAMCLLPST